ncbi:MAG TPA: nuclear transport factor 2 family protein [Puia sp.]|nr:nuclear transport factor 2 family protein [Puia sp.]
MRTTISLARILMICAVLTFQAASAQTSRASAAVPQNETNEKLVRAYYTAFVKKDWHAMEQILADGFTFSSPLHDHIPVMVFKERCWPNANNIKRCEVEKLIVYGDEAYVIYNGWTLDGK